MVSDDVDDWDARAGESHARLVREGNARAALACAAAALERLHRERGAPPGMDRWLEALDRHIDAAKEIAWADVEPFVFQSGAAVLGRRPAHPALPLWHARALACLRARDSRPEDAMRAARFSFEYAVRGGNFLLAHEIVGRAQAHVARTHAAAHRDWFEAEALEARLSGENARARRAVADALAAGGGHAAWEQGASAALADGDLADADACLEAMGRTVDPRRAQDVAHGLFLAAARARLGGDTDAAGERIDACLRVDASSIPTYFTTTWRLGRAHVDVACGRYRHAAMELGVVLARSASHYWRFLEFSALMSRAWLRVRERRDAEALADLDAALAQSAPYRACEPWRDPEAIGEVVRFARDARRDGAELAAFAAQAALR